MEMGLGLRVNGEENGCCCRGFRGWLLVGNEKQMGYEMASARFTGQCIANYYVIGDDMSPQGSSPFPTNSK